MSKQEILEKVQAVISDATDIDVKEIKADSMLMDDLELSSLEIMTIVADLESAFRIRVKKNDMQNLVTVSDVVDSIEKLMK